MNTLTCSWRIPLNWTQFNTCRWAGRVPHRASAYASWSIRSLMTRQCNGTRISDGEPCRRHVRTDSHTGSVYCHWHQSQKKPVQKTNGDTTSRISSILHDCWHVWIGAHIKQRDRKRIRSEMEKPLSDSDESGYIYAYHLTQGQRASTARFAYFKIGRTTNPRRRMDQVSRRCNHLPTIIELFPALTPSSARSTPQVGSLSNTWTKCPMSHRVERLIHLELESLFKISGFKCKKCGTSHREWVRVPRTCHDDGTPMTDKELWDTQVRPIVLRWVQFGVLAAVLQQNNAAGTAA